MNLITSMNLKNSWSGRAPMSDAVPFYSLQDVPNSLKREWQQEIAKVIHTGTFIGGKRVAQFEEVWSSDVHSKYALSVGNGFDGLLIALLSLGIKPGDHVAVPAHTFIACWFAIHKAGGIPIGVDVDESGLLDLQKLFQIHPTPKFVMPVHMHGQMVDMQKLMSWAYANSVLVIEDASQSHGAEFLGKQAGTWGHMGVYSLYPTKNLFALGDAGVIVSNDENAIAAARHLANYGSSLSDKYKHVRIGMNSRLDEMQAAILLVNLKYFRNWTKRRQEIGYIYEQELNCTPYIEILQQSGPENVRHHFPIKTKNRDELRKILDEQGVRTEIHYPVLASAEFQKISNQQIQEFPEATKVSSQILSLPITPWMDNKKVMLVSAKLRRIMETK
jgi:dTDP-4-amino-4,6-dideoxygalactose transaminase